MRRNGTAKKQLFLQVNLKKGKKKRRGSNPPFLNSCRRNRKKYYLHSSNKVIFVLNIPVNFKDRADEKKRIVYSCGGGNTNRICKGWGRESGNPFSSAGK